MFSRLGSMRLTGKVRLTIAVAVCASAMILILSIDAAVYPWAHSLTRGATLTGEWFGEMTTPTGAKHFVWIEIDHAIGTCYGCPSIEGRAATCGAKETQHYEVWGGVEDWRGTQFYLKMRETEESDVRLLYIAGKWSGDQVSLTTTLVAPGTPTTTRWERNDAGENTTVVEGHPDTRAPIMFSLGRGTLSDFEARCKAGGS